jgi:LAO/AO transport system kinase
MSGGKSAPASTKAPAVEELALKVMAGDRRALGRAITLVESTRPDDHAAAQALIERLLPATGRSIRIGLSGPPGVGKSTLTERLGLHVVAAGHRLAVLAVDPSSKLGGGSILGDKTRMPELSRDPRAFIRPSPAGTSAGGVARRTREALLLVEAAGFDVVIVETVGVGQSETAVADMTDLFVLLAQPGAGDELQGIKRGIVELADLVLVTKADGELAPAAMRTAAELAQALRYLRPPTPGFEQRVLRCSGLTGLGVAEAWAAMAEFGAHQRAGGGLARRRAEQAKAWLRRELSDGLLERLKDLPDAARRLRRAEAQVATGALNPPAAARRLIEGLLGAKSKAKSRASSRTKRGPKPKPVRRS